MPLIFKKILAHSRSRFTRSQHAGHRAFLRLRKSRKPFAALAGLTLFIGTLSAISPQTAGAQSAALNVNMSLEVPAGATQLNLPTFSPGRLIVQVANTGTTPVVNQPMVMRIANQPDVILTVSDGTGNVGIVDQATGAWYHTVASIPPGASATYVLTFVKYCPGRWSIAVRIGDRLASSVAQWTGPADPRCGADELVSPPSQSFYQLPWPPTTPTSTSTSSIVPPVSSATSPANNASLTTIATSVVPTTRNLSAPPTLIQLTLGQSTATATSTSLPPASTTLLGATSSTVFGATSTRPPSTTTPASTTSTTRSGPTTTVVIFCKTVSGKRYCAPLSSAYKPGQKKATEIKPTTTKKKKKK